MFKKTLRGRNVPGDDFSLYCTPEGRLILLQRLSTRLDKFIFIKNIAKNCILNQSENTGCAQGCTGAMTKAGHPRNSTHFGRKGKKNLRKGDSFLFDILQIKRDAGYLCWDVAAKSLSPCGTKQGFVVGFERAV